MGCYHCYLNWSPVAVPGRQQPTLGNIDDVAGEGSSLSQCAVGIEGCVDDLAAPGNEPACLVSLGCWRTARRLPLPSDSAHGGVPFEHAPLFSMGLVTATDRTATRTGRDQGPRCRVFQPDSSTGAGLVRSLRWRKSELE